MKEISTLRCGSFVCTMLAIVFVTSATAGMLAQTIETAQEIAWIGNTYSGLVVDSAGNLYGTYDSGGDYTNCFNGCGQVYELVRNSDGSYTQTVIYNFAGGTDGSTPGGLVIDSAGNLYGATGSGGSDCNVIGCGVVYKLSPSSSIGWTETVLYRFSDAARGLYPGGLVLDGNGNIFGATASGGEGTGCGGSGCGVAFKIAPTSRGNWKESVLYRFAGGAAGFNPVGPLTLDQKGHIYGVLQAGGNTSAACGPNGCGLVFELVNTSHGWKEAAIHTFHGDDGAQPLGGLALDAAGNLYGSTQSGGHLNFGLAFKLSPARGAWKGTLLHNFTGGTDGDYPTSGLVFDKAGNLYGTTAYSNSVDCNDYCGQVFELSPSSGLWNVKAVFLVPLGYYPSGGLAVDSAGNLFGTALDNHYFSGGAAFEVTP
jgi:hypothetical protein